MVQRDVFYPKDEEMQVTGFIFTYMRLIFTP